MIRFLIRIRSLDRSSEARWTDYKTLDLDVPELEQELRSGGMGQSQYRIPEIAGVELLDPEKKPG